MKKLKKDTNMKKLSAITKLSVPIGVGALLLAPVAMTGCDDEWIVTDETLSETETLDQESETVIETESESVYETESVFPTEETTETAETETMETSVEETETLAESETVKESKETAESKAVKESKTVEESKSAPSEETKESVTSPSVPAENSASNGEVHSGYATFYGAGPGGCCLLDDYEDVYYTVAMNRPDYNEMNLAGAYLEVTDKDGDKINVMVTNELPEGNHGDLDLSIAAFGAIEPLETGRMKASWKIIPLPTNEPIYYKYKPSSSQWWVEVQVRNHRYPLKSVEYKAANGEFVALERKPYNYYCAPLGMGSAGPFTFRVTDMYGHVLIDENVPLDTNEKCIPGAANFPY